ncbi:retrovirus-related pol polyprotein from transposon TNT 1-94 [Tanacetum coccineum]
MSAQNKAQYFADIRVMIYILQGIPNDIYNFVDACPDAQTMWKIIKSSLYSHSPQPYYVTHPSSVIDNDDDYQGEIQGDAQEDKRTTGMMLLARAITQPRMLAMQGMGKTNGQCYNCNGKGHYARECPKLRVRDAKYFREQMLLTTKDEELNAVMIMIARIQPTDDKSDTKPTYDAEFISEVNTLQVDMINGLLSKSDHEQCHHEKLETIIHTSVDDQIDSNIIFDDLYVDNNSGQTKHDTNVHDLSLHDFESLLNNVQVEAEKQCKMNIELKKQKAVLYYKQELGREQLLNEKEEIREEFLKTQDEILKIKHEIDSFKKAFKAREDHYLEDIVSLEEKLRSHDRIVYKMSHSLQIIHMLSENPNKVYDLHLKTGLGFENPKRLKKAIEAQLKMYDGEKLESKKLKVDLPDYEETLEDAEKSRLKMKDKMIPQTQILVEQTYFSSPFTSNVSPESSLEKFDVPPKRMPNESKLLKLFRSRIRKLFTQEDVNELIENVNQKTYAYGDVHAKNQDLLMTIFELKAKLKLVEKGKNVNTKFDKSKTLEKLICVTPLNKNKDLKAKLVSKVEVKTDKSKLVTSYSTPKNEQGQKKNANVLARGMYRVMKTETQMLVAKANMFSSNSTGVASSSSVKRPESKDTNSKKRVLLNTKSKSTSKDVNKSQISVSLVSNKCDTMNLNVSKSSANVLKAKNVNVVHDGLNLIVLWIVDSGCSKHMTGNLKLLRNFVEKFMGTGEDLLTGSCDSNIYTISISKMAASPLVCLMSKATSKNHGYGTDELLI